jgi:hypothetical protein
VLNHHLSWQAVTLLLITPTFEARTQEFAGANFDPPPGGWHFYRLTIGTQQQTAFPSRLARPKLKNQKVLDFDTTTAGKFRHPHVDERFKYNLDVMIAEPRFVSNRRDRFSLIHFLP